MDEGDAAGRVAVSGHFTPSIDETDDNTAGDENAVYFEDVHTGLLGVWGQTYSAAFFDRGTAVEYYTHCGKKAHAGVELAGGSR